MSEWTILSASDGFNKRQRLQSTQNRYLLKVFFFTKKHKMANECYKFIFQVFESDLYEFWLGINEYLELFQLEICSAYCHPFVTPQVTSGCSLNLNIITHIKENKSATNWYFYQIWWHNGNQNIVQHLS